ncbi:LPXTG cell wall anchor domain-containing protein [Streptomyces sp. NPDC048389]|uniref:LPXTG cell wall anchor domain-containing protein n=1 Tax=Streptomyces sp. NPDC048389 TaxID=3154622 RepID=UPI0034571CBC
MPISRNRWAVAAPAVASLLLAASAAPAFATDGTSSPVLRQELPRTAMDKGAPQQGFGNCADIPADKDGWHFVLPGNKAHFVKLTATFEPGGTQVLTSFGPPSDMHAYVASEPGATLTSVTAEIEGSVPKNKFNLSHTCPAGEGTPENPGDKPGEKPGEKPGDKPDEKPDEQPDEQPGDKPDEKPGEDDDKPDEKPGEDDGSTPSTPAESGDATEPAASESPAAGASGDLAETGNGAPVGVLAAVAAALVAGGGYLLARRRTARQH